MNDIYDWIDRASDPYGERHRYKTQNFVDGIPIDPAQRYYFDMTPNEERPAEEIDDWWDKPYIVPIGFSRDTYKEYALRMKGHKKMETEEGFNLRKQNEYKAWCKKYKDGYAYNVRVLSGGAWDRSSSLGSFDTLEEALEVAKNYKKGEMFKYEAVL